MPPTVQQPAAPQPVQQAVVPPVPPVAEPPAAQQPEADTEKSVAEQPAAQKEVDPVAQWVNPRYADEAEHTDPELENIPNISVHIDTEPDSADDDDEPEEKGFYRRGSRLRKFPEEFVVIDFETTGFSPIQNEIIEVGMLKVCGTDVVDSYQQLVRPNKPVSARITKITGITNEMLKEAPAASDITPDVLDFIGDLPLVGHNVSFDVGFLVRNANLYCDGDTAFSSFDTMQCAKRELPFLPDYKLGTVANYFDCQDETAHRALADCHSTLGCFIGLMNYNE
nr:MAG TPA: DNA polymerase III subunit alpha [Caudoviricetes sp.]